MSNDRILLHIVHAAPYVSLYVAAIVLGFFLLKKSRSAGVLMLIGGFLSLLVMLIREAFREYALNELNGGNPAIFDGWIYQSVSIGCGLLQALGLACFLAAAVVGRSRPKTDES